MEHVNRAWAACDSASGARSTLRGSTSLPVKVIRRVAPVEASELADRPWHATHARSGNQRRRMPRRLHRSEVSAGSEDEAARRAAPVLEGVATPGC